MTHSDDPVIRLAGRGDLEDMTALHCDSFKFGEHVPAMLGRHYVRAMYRWLVTSAVSYALVAEREGKIVGIVAVCDGPFTRPMFLACLPAFAVSLVRRPALLFNHKLWSRLFRRPDVTSAGRKIADQPGFAQMTIGVVDKNCRGRGIFPALVEETKTYSRRRGSRAIRAGIYKINQPSRRVFIKGRWIETPELETEDTVFYVAYLDEAFAGELGLRSAAASDEKSV
ncbi:MAG: GNAT family N-acetyltransferase [Acidobacteria bacterium]|nr:GNAT family N-acetyltransferase [Acidobacteriota bacterium]HOU49036.1 GNAT family N-acetyltransferase [Candidatus Aminicenantes bacterium]HOY98512.1 GNAT family N-acetyltransferase [Candidatus Aminicenantes bacterium]HPN16472.1 GNAT family N-acetyltransferase [Candidatus Aminicenantes bacterium]HQH46158.1 GNAT family N-acetyltransferase [Candidatus Aminicenantes bacterium]